jgi:hypothetical protein
MLSCSGVSAFLMASGVCWVVLSGGDVLTSWIQQKGIGPPTQQLKSDDGRELLTVL